MPRPRPRTRLHVLAEVITALDKATTGLQEIDLRSTNVEMRSELKQARDLAVQAFERTQDAYRQAAVELGPARR